MPSISQNLSRTLAALAVVGGLAAACAAVETLKPDFYPQKGQPHTLTYTDKAGKDVVVYDLRGKWEAEYAPVNAPGREVVIIKQKGNSFEGKKTIGSAWIGKGQTTIKGTINGNVIDCVLAYDVEGWLGWPQKIEKDGNSFKCYYVEFKRLPK